MEEALQRRTPGTPDVSLVLLCGDSCGAVYGKSLLQRSLTRQTFGCLIYNFTLVCYFVLKKCFFIDNGQNAENDADD